MLKRVVVTRVETEVLIEGVIDACHIAVFLKIFLVLLELHHPLLPFLLQFLPQPLEILFHASLNLEFFRVEVAGLPL